MTAKPASPAVYRRRRATALAVLIALVAVGALALGHGSSRPKPVAKHRAVATPAPKPPELPRGGRTILPNFRVVAYYGAPQDRQLGALGIGTPDHAAKRLAHQAAPDARGSRAPLPAPQPIAGGAARPARAGADRRRRGRRARAERPLQPAPAGLRDPPLSEGRAQGQGPAAARHPAGALGLLHRDDAPAQVAQEA